MTLTFHQWPWIKVMALPWVQYNNSVKYYSNSWTQWKVKARTMSKSTMGIVTMTFDQWPWIKVVTLPYVQCNNFVKYYSNLCFQWKLMARTMFKPYEHSDLDLSLITLDQGHDTTLCPGQQSCEILFKFMKRIRSYGLGNLFPLCVKWPWSLTSDLGSTSWHFLGPSVTIPWNIIPIHAFSENLRPGPC
jgi:hypothetical protein